MAFAKLKGCLAKANNDFTLIRPINGTAIDKRKRHYIVLVSLTGALSFYRTTIHDGIIGQITSKTSSIIFALKTKSYFKRLNFCQD